MRQRWQGVRALLSLCASAALGWAISASTLGVSTARATGGAYGAGAGDVRPPVSAVQPACGVGRPCTGTAGCASECDEDTSLIAGCARCEKGRYVGCSQGECQAIMEFAAAATEETVCPNQLMTPCPKIGDMCSIGRTSHRCRCSPVGALQLPKWICK